MGSVMVVILPPGLQFRPHFFDRSKLIHIQAFVTQTSVEGLDEGIFRRLPGSYEIKLHPPHALAQRQMPGGFGGLMSFEMKGSFAAAQAFLNHMQLPKRAVSFGGFESLATQPGAMWRGSIGEDKATEAGITAGLIRLSIGLEHPEDLIADLNQALAHATT